MPYKFKYIGEEYKSQFVHLGGILFFMWLCQKLTPILMSLSSSS